MQQQVITEFSVLHQNLSTEFVAKCVEICNECDIAPEHLMYRWESYIDKRSLVAEQAMKVEHLENLKAEIMRKIKARQPTDPLTIDQHPTIDQLGAFMGR